jgi:voltage-gated potassium channel
LAGLCRPLFLNRLLYAGAFSFLGLSTILGGTTIFLVERADNPAVETMGDGLWWAIVTLTTVGFGDISPVTPLGRGVGAVLMVVGMFTLALFAGVVGHSLLNSVLSFREEQFRMNTHTNHIVVCGYSAGSRMLLNTLRRERDWGSREVILFCAGERPPDIPPEFNWITGDPTKESELVKVRLTHAHSVILVGDRGVLPQSADATTILSLFTIRHWMSEQPETGARKTPLYIVAEILDVENVAHAKAAGASEVIESTLVSCSLLAHAVSMPGRAHALSRIAEAAGNSLYVGDIPADVELPRSFAELGRALRTSTGLILVGVMSPAGEQRLNPPDDLPIMADDRLVYLATGPVLSKA